MRRVRFFAALAMLGLCLAAPLDQALARTELTMQYPYPDLFRQTQQDIATAFAKVHPEITVSFRAPYKDYEDATQRVLREAVTGDTPDVTFQGLNRIRVFADKGVATPLDDFIAAEKDFAASGFNEAMFDAGRVNGKVYGVPFAISLPIAYYNLDLVKKAGGDPDHLPVTWDEVVALAKKINALGPDVHGLILDWDISGNWFWQALVFENGGRMMTPDEKRVAFGDAAGQQAMRTLARLVAQAKAPNFSGTDGRTAFTAGKIGILLTTTGYLKSLDRQIGNRFSLKTNDFPGVRKGVSRLPVGGNVAIITAKDPARRKAAWEALKFWTGPEGATTMVKTTGYMAANNKANEVDLKDYYQDHANQYTAVRQLPLMTGWYAFPGENGLKITDIIKDSLQSIMDGSRVHEPDTVLSEMVAAVQAQLPEK